MNISDKMANMLNNAICYLVIVMLIDINYHGIQSTLKNPIYIKKIVGVGVFRFNAAFNRISVIIK